MIVFRLASAITTGSGTTLTDGEFETQDNALDVDGTLTLESTMDATLGASTINVAGDYIDNGATLDLGTSTVVLDADDTVQQNVLGATNFYNLTITEDDDDANGRTIGFEESQTHTINGTLTAASTATDVIAIVSVTSAEAASTTAHTINNVNGLYGTVEYVSVEYSTLQDGGVTKSPELNPSNSSESTLLTSPGWFPVPNISGTVYTDLGVTPYTTADTVNVFVNGVTDGTGTISAVDGTYTVTLSALPSAGDVITVFIDDDGASNTNDAVAVTRHDGATNSLSGVDLYMNNLITRTEDGTALTSADLDTAHDGTEADLTAVYTDGATTSIPSGKNLYVWSGGEFAPGAVLTVNGDTQIAGTLTLTTLADDFAGSITTESGATLTATSGTMTVGGNWTNDANATFIHNSGTVQLDGGGTNTLTTGGDAFNVLINENDTTLQDAFTTDVFTNETGAVFDLNGNDFTVTTTFTNGTTPQDDDGTLKLEGTETVSIPANDTDSGSWEFTGDADFVDNGPIDISTFATTYFELSFISDNNIPHPVRDTFETGTGITINEDLVVGNSSVGGGTFNTNGNQLDVEDGVIIRDGGQLSLGSSTVNVGRNFTINDDPTTVFDAGTSTVNMLGDSFESVGDIYFSLADATQAFYNLNIVDAADDATSLNVEVRDGDTVQIATGGNLTITGFDATDDQVLISSGNVGTEGFIDLIDGSGSATITNVLVEDNHLLYNGVVASPELNPAGSAENTNGNTQGWFTLPTISGTVYTDQGTTPYTTADTVNVFVNGVTAGTGTISAVDGTYSVTLGAQPAAEDIITIFVDGGSINAVTVTRHDGAIILSGMDLYQDHMIARTETATALTSGDADTANDGDADITAIYADNGTSNHVMAAGKDMFIWAGDTFAPSSDAEFQGGLYVYGTFDFNGLTYINEDVYFAPGSALTGTPAAFDTAGTVAQTITTNGVVLPILGNTNTTDTVTLADNLNVSGNLTTAASSTLDVAGNDLTVGGTFAHNGTLKLQGDETMTLTQDTDSGTFEYYGDGTTTSVIQTIIDFGGTDYFNLVINDADATGSDVFELAADLTIAGDLTVTDAELDTLGRAIDVTGSVDVQTNGTLTAGASAITVETNWTTAGTFNSDTSTVTFDGAANDHTITGSTTWYNLSVVEDDDADVATITLQDGETQTIAAGGSLTLDGFDADDTVTLVSNPGAANAIVNVIDGSSAITADFVDVTFNTLQYNGVTAVPTLNPTGGVDNGNTNGWFGLTVELSDSADGTLETTDETTEDNHPTLLVTGIYGSATTIDIYDVTGGTATDGGTDYTYNGVQTVTIPAGTYDGTTATDIVMTTEMDAMLDLVGDSDAEGNETIVVGIQNPSAGVTIGDADADTTTQSSQDWVLTDDDPVIIEFSLATGASTLENDNDNFPTLFVKGTVPSTYTVDLIDDLTGTATDVTQANSDYLYNTPQTISIPAGSYDGTIATAITLSSLYTASDDATVETGGETVDFSLGNLVPANPALFTTGDADGDLTTESTHTYTITDDDANELSGTVYSDNGVTPATDGAVVRLLVNGVDSGLTTTLANGDGTYAVGPLAATYNAGDVLTLYLDNGGAPQGVLVTKGAVNDGGLSGLNIYQDDLIIRSEDGTAVTNDDLYTGFGGATPDTDVSAIATVSAASAGTLATAGAGEVIVWTGDEFAPGGNLDIGTGGIDVDGTVTMVGETINVEGDLNLDATATFTPGTSAVVLDGTTAQTITTNGATLGDVTASGSGGVTLADDFNAASLTIAGTGASVSSGTSNVTLSGDLYVDEGTLTGGSGDYDVNGNLLSDEDGNVSLSSGNTNVAGDVDLGGDSLTHNNGNVIMDGTGAQNFSTAGDSLYNVEVNKASGTATMQDDVVAANNFTITNGDVDMNGQNADVENDVLLNGGTINLGTGTHTVAGDWTNTGTTVTAGASTVTLDGTASQTLTSGGQSFNNLTNADATASTVMADALTVTGTYANADGAVLEASGNDLTIGTLNNGSTGGNTAATIQLHGTETVTITTPDTDSGTFEFVGNGTGTSVNANIPDFGSDPDYYRLVINDTSASNSDEFLMSGSVGIVENLEVTDGVLDADTATVDVDGNLTIDAAAAMTGGTSTINLAGDWTNNGTFTPEASSVVLDGTTQAITGATDFYNLSKTSAGAAEDVTFESGSTFNVNNNLVLDGTLGTLTIDSSTPTTPATLNVVNGAGSITATGLDVTDNNLQYGGVTASPVNNPASSTDSGNTTGWFGVIVEFAAATAASTDETAGDASNFPTLLVNGTVGTATSVDLADLLTGSATSGGTDYSFTTPQTITIPAGSYDGTVGTQITITNPNLPVIAADGDSEGPETVDMTLNNAGANVTIGDANGDLTTQTTLTYTITDDDPVLVELSAATAASTDESGVADNFPVLLVLGELTAPATVEFVDLATGSATGTGTDYLFNNQGTGNEVTIPAGSYDGTLGTAITLNSPAISQDTDTEGNETIDFTLQTPTGVTIGDANVDLTTQTLHTYTVTDDDASGLIVQFDSATYSAAEAAGTLTLNLQVSNADTSAGTLADTVDVDVLLTGTATGGGTDYTYTDPTTVTIPKADYTTPQLVTTNITLVDDALVEGDETIDVQLTNLVDGDTVGHVLGGQTTATATITDDETASVDFLSGSSTTGGDEDGAIPAVVVELTMTSTTGVPALATGETITVDVSYNGVSTATNAGGDDVDFTSPETITFTDANVTGDTIAPTITLTDDSVDEADETAVFDVTLVGAGTLNGESQVSLGANVQHILTINDDDNPVVDFQQATSNVSDTATTHVVVVNTDIAPVVDVTVPITVNVASTAVATTDYTAPAANVTILAGSTFGILEIPILTEATVDGAKTLVLDIGVPVNANAGVTTQQHTVTIIDDEATGSAFISYDNGTFSEAVANDGSIGNTVTLELSGDTFATKNASLTGGGTEYTANNVPAGLTVDIATNASGTGATITLNGNATTHTNTEDISNMEIVFADAAFDTIAAASITNSTKSNLIVDFDDPATAAFVTYNTGTFSEAAANDGSISNALSISLSGDTFVVSGGVMTAATHYTVNNVPAGLTAVVTGTSTTTATVTLTGNATSNLDADDIANMEVAFLDAAFTTNPAASVTNSTKSDIIVDFDDPTSTPFLSYNTATFSEAVANDGSIGNTLTLTLSGDTFATVGTLTGGGTDYTVNNLPAGLTMDITTGSTTSATVTLTGNATTHADAQDISNLEIVFADAAFTGASAASVTNSTKSDIIVDFDDPVASSTVVFSATSFVESVLNDGTIDNGTPITATLTGDTFVVSGGAMTEGTHFAATNVPAGLTVVVTGTSTTTADITISGTATSSNNADDISNLSIAFLPAAFTSGITAGGASSLFSVDFTETTLSGSLAYSTDTFTESVLNDGSIGNTSTITITGDTFASAVRNTTLTGGGTHYTINNLPAGLTESIDVDPSGIYAVVTLGGNATSNLNADDISNLEIIFADAVFTGGIASAITNSTKSDLNVDFESVDPSNVNIAQTIVGVEGTNDVEFTITLDEKATTTVNYTYTLTDGTAASPADYTNSPVAGSIAVGQQSTTITVPVVADAADDGNGTALEDFTINLSTTGGLVDSTSATGQIVDVDSASGLPTDIDGDTLPDSQEDAGFNSGDINGDGIDDDLQPHVGSDSTGTNGIEVQNGCQVLGSLTNNAESANGSQDDPYDYPEGFQAYTLTCTNPGDTATVKLYFETTLTSTDGIVLRKYNSGTSSYTTVPNVTLAIETVGAVNVITATYDVTDGGAFDADGTANAQIVDPVGLGTTLVDFDSASTSQTEDATTVNVSASIGTALTQNVVVTYALSGTATLTTDYTDDTALSITIPAGSTSGNASITIVEDSTVEGSETVILTMTGATNASIGTTTVHTITINNDDSSGGGGGGGGSSSRLNPPSTGSASSYFSDIDDSVCAGFVDNLRRDSILNGFSDGTFRPQGIVTRGQMATFIVRGLGLTAESTPVAGVTSSTRYVQVVSSVGYVNFRTGNSVGAGLIGRINNGEQLRVIEQAGSWWKVDFNGTEGWVFGTYVREISGSQEVVNTIVTEFADSIEGPHKGDIEILAGLGIISGFSDGTFRLDEPVTRDQAAKFVYNGLKSKGVALAEVDADFPDVADNSKFTRFIGTIQNMGIINGFSDGTYKPADGLTRCQMSKIVDIARTK